MLRSFALAATLALPLASSAAYARSPCDRIDSTVFQHCIRRGRPTSSCLALAFEDPDQQDDKPSEGTTVGEDGDNHSKGLRRNLAESSVANTAHRLKDCSGLIHSSSLDLPIDTPCLPSRAGTGLCCRCPRCRGESLGRKGCATCVRLCSAGQTRVAQAARMNCTVGNQRANLPVSSAAPECAEHGPMASAGGFGSAPLGFPGFRRKAIRNSHSIPFGRIVRSWQSCTDCLDPDEAAGDACGAGESLHRASSAGNRLIASDLFERCQLLASFGPQSCGGRQWEASQRHSDVAC